MITQLITDTELLARYNDELFIDDLDRHVETQKSTNHSRNREAVEAAAAVWFNHEQR